MDEGAARPLSGYVAYLSFKEDAHQHSFACVEQAWHLGRFALIKLRVSSATQSSRRDAVTVLLTGKATDMAACRRWLNGLRVYPGLQFQQGSRHVH